MFYRDKCETSKRIQTHENTHIRINHGFFVEYLQILI
jgi:hypothetical protein